MFSVVSKVKRTWSEINKARKSLRVLVKETGGIGKTCQRLQVMNKRWNGFFGQDAIAGKKVLLVAHELTATGAPRMLFYAALAVKNSGGIPVVLCSQDGVMRGQMEEKGIAVVVDKQVMSSFFLLRSLARRFDVVVVNTVVLSPVVRLLSEIEGVRVIWWLHEAQALSTHLRDNKDLANRDIQLLCVSEYARSFVPSTFQSLVLRNGIPSDVSVGRLNREHNKFTFSLVGTIEPRKGQDIFFNAIALLPDDIRINCIFVLAGKLWDNNKMFWEQALESVSGCSEIQYLGLLDHTQIIELIARTDVQVCCSRDEPFSLVCLEAAMTGCASLLNENVGVVEVFSSENSCLVFEANNPQSLAEQMVYAYQNPKEVQALGQRARETFERHLTIEQFSKAFLELLP